MLLSKYKAFLHEVSLDKTISDSVESMMFYRKWKDIWYDGNENKVDDEGLTSQLETTLDSGIHWRLAHSRIAYFPIPELFSVSVVMINDNYFSRAPTIKIPDSI